MKETFYKLTNTKLKKTIFIIITILIFNFLISLITGVNLIAKAYNFLSTISNGYNTENKKVVLKSDNYDTDTAGNYKITTTTDWIDLNKAHVTLNLETILKYNNVSKDIIFAIDTSNTEKESGFCNTTNLNSLKKVSNTIINDGGTVSYITFAEQSSIIGSFINDKTTASNMLDTISCSTKQKEYNNYYAALKNVTDLVKDYSQGAKELTVIFITDGYPNKESPNELGEYEIIKQKQPNLKISSISYNLGDTKIKNLTTISDELYSADYLNFEKVLKEVIMQPLYYDYVNIDTYVDNDYFTINDNSTIKTSFGVASLELKNSKQVLNWSFDSNKLKTGNTATLEFDVEIITNKIGVKGYFPINKNINITSKLPEETTYEQNFTTTPVLKSGYTVHYNANAPSGCNISKTNDKYYYAFETVEKPSETPICDGYQFKGWQVLEEVTNISDEAIVMPTNDINIVGTWSKLAISKSMTGTVYEKTNLYKTIAQQAVLDNAESAYVTSKNGIDFTAASSNTNGKGAYTIASTKDDKYPIHYFRGDIDYNNVIFAGLCWKIVRTTETGGVKIIYNGVPANNQCSEVDETSYISITQESPYYLGKTGYMYNDSYQLTNKILDLPWFDLASLEIKTNTNIANTEYYYSKEVTYANGKYNLSNPQKFLWSSNYDNLENYYTCQSTETSCTEVSYVYSTFSSQLTYIALTGGKTKETYEKEAANTYWIYGNDVEYSNGTYTLKDTISVAINDYANKYNEIASSHHYTCLSTSKNCNTVYYINYATSRYIIYSNLTNGKKITDILPSLTENSSNSDSLNLKNTVDKWYTSNVYAYEDFLEDTIWCNDRSVAEFNGWQKDGNAAKRLIFKAYNRVQKGTPSLTCANAKDRFTKNTANGNGKLTYPTGLITSDELMYLGKNIKESSKTYLNSSSKFQYNCMFSMSPSDFEYAATFTSLCTNGATKLSTTDIGTVFTVRPMISLKPGIDYTAGDGTANNPYIILAVNTYTVIYNGNGSTGGSTTSSTHLANTEKKLTANGFTKAGYTFKGWATSADGEVVYSDEQAVTNLTSIGNSIILYAVWQVNSYTLTINPNGGTWNNSTTTQTATQNYGTTKEIANPTRTGYTFGGWTTSGACSLSSTTFTYGAGNCTITASWTANTYTVAYNGNGNTGGSMANSTHTYDTAKKLTTNAYTKTGYSFSGWATSANGNVAYTNGQSVTNLATSGTVTLYAKWTINSYTLTINPNGGTWNNSTATQTAKQNYGTTKEIANPTRTGYTFGGWTTSGTCSLSGSTFTYGAGNCTLTAKWTGNTYTVVYKGNGSTGGSTASSSHTYGVAKNLTANGFSRAYTVTFNHNYTGSTNTTKTATYTFKNWNTNAAGTGTTYTNSQSVTNLATTGTVNLYAQWNSASVTYVPTRTGYTFGGWYAEAGCTTNKAGTNGVFTPTSNITLYAKWTPNTYKVAYNGNGSTGGSTASSSHTYGVAKNLTANGFSRAYTVTFNHNYTGSTNTTRTATYTFKNWNTNAAGTGTTYTNSQSVTNLATSGTFNLYAQWNSASVTYVPTRTGYTFGGWYAEAGCKTNKAGTNGVFTPASNVTLYAKWTINSYTLTINPNGGTWSNSTATQTAKQNYGTTKTVANPTRTGYTFGGWTTSGTCSLSGTTFTYGAGNCTITAKWTPNTYTVAYNGNGSTGGSMANSTHTYDTAKKLTTNAYTKTGYSFSGWATSANGNVAYTNGQSVTNLATSGTVTLYAKWTINSYTLTFNANNGTVSPTSIKQNYGTSLTLPTPTRSGYKFLGWYTAASGGTKRTYTTMPAVNETLYAQWEKISTLTFSHGTKLTLSSTTGGNAYTTVTVPAGATIYFTCSHNPSGVANGYCSIFKGATYGSGETSNATSVAAYDRTQSGSYSYTTETATTILLQIAGGGPGTNSACTSHGGTNCPTGWYSGTLTVTKITDASGNEYKFS